MTLFWRTLAGAGLVMAATPAMAQHNGEAQDALGRASPGAREHFLQRASGRDAALIECLNFREQFPMRE